MVPWDHWGQVIGIYPTKLTQQWGSDPPAWFAKLTKERRDEKVLFLHSLRLRDYFWIYRYDHGISLELP